MTDKKKNAPQNKAPKKKGMPEIREQDRNDPHRGITKTPPQHGKLAPEEEEFDEDDFREEPEHDEEEE